MAKRESAYDLQKDIKSYLKALHKKTRNFAKAYSYTQVDHQSDDVVYLRNHMDSHTGIDDGLESAYVMQKYKIKEQKTLRANAKNYIKKYYADGLLKEVECFVDGSLDCRFVAVYNENKRYLLPFSETGGYYPTYIHVLATYEDYYEEYEVDDAQIVYRKYTRLPDNKYGYLCINYIPEGTYPINSLEIGTFDVGEQIQYSKEHDFCWYDEFDAKRKNIPFHLPSIPYVVQLAKGCEQL